MITEVEYERERLALTVCSKLDAKEFDRFLKDEINLGPKRRARVIDEVQTILLTTLGQHQGVIKT